MKKVLFSIFALLTMITANLYSQSGWIWQNPSPQGNDLRNIKMFSSGTGYCHSYYNILKTTNNGTNWQVISNFNGYITHAFFVNEQTAYLLDYDFLNTSKLFKSTDGGVNWQFIYSFTAFNAESFWSNELTGFSRSGTFSGGTQIQKTTNGGSSWFNVFLDTTINILAWHFPSQTHGYIGGKSDIDFFNGKLLKTTNGGNSWDSITIRGIREVRSIYFLDNMSGFVSGLKSHSTGPCVLRTTTGGTTWDSVYYSSNSQLYFQNLNFINFNTGYGGSLYRTTNAGVNWLFLNPYTEAGISVSSFSITNDQSLFICGLAGKLAQSTNGGTSWISNSKGYYWNIQGLKFFDANTGIAVGGNFNMGIVLRTTNSGLIWDTTRIDPSELNGITLYNENTAYIAGVGKVFKTTDKGMSFTSFNTFTNAGWSAVTFTDENTGYTISKYKIADKTTNGGQTWFNILPMNGGEYFTHCFINSTTGFIAGTKIFKTTNGGSSWDTIRTGIQPFFNVTKITYINNILYSLGSIAIDGRRTAVITKSTDLGISWSADSIQNDNDLFDISIPSPGMIYMLGTNAVYKSVNNSPWVTYGIYTRSIWKSSLHFVNNDTGFVTTYNGGILKTTNGGGTPIGINPQSNEIPNKFTLFQNYPNPFNPSTIIEYSLPKSSLVKIKIYDLLGRFVKLLVNEQKSYGNYTISFDGTSLASGVYFYTIETPDFIQSKKMVLLK